MELKFGFVFSLATETSSGSRGFSLDGWTLEGVVVVELVPLGVVEFEFCVPENGVEIDSLRFLTASCLMTSLTRGRPFSPPGFNKGSIGRIIGVSVFRLGNSVT